MGTCKDCKHWVEGWQDYPAYLAPPVIRQDYGVCKMVEFAGIVQEVLGNEATIYFGVGDDIQFVTKETFGCNQYEATV